jgi:hypothetical protein
LSIHLASIAPVEGPEELDGGKHLSDDDEEAAAAALLRADPQAWEHTILEGPSKVLEPFGYT